MQILVSKKTENNQPTLRKSTSASLQTLFPLPPSPPATFSSSVPSPHAMLSPFGEAADGAGDWAQRVHAGSFTGSSPFPLAPLSSCSSSPLAPAPAQAWSSFFPPSWSSVVFFPPSPPALASFLLLLGAYHPYFKMFSQRCDRLPRGWAQPCPAVGLLEPSVTDCD